MSAFVGRHALGLIVIAGGVLRFATLDQGYWLDEQITLAVISGHGSGDGLIDMLRAVGATESNPPVYYVALWLWEKLFGTGELAIRSLSALAGIATIPVLYLAARDLGSRRAGLIAAGLAAASPLLVWYSQEVRNYEFLVLIAALSFVCFVRALRDPGHRWLWLWAIVSALALTTHYFAFALIVPQAIWLLARRSAALPDLTLALGTIVAVGIALLPLVATQRGRGSWIADYDFAERLLQVPEHFLVGYTVPWEAIPAIALALVAVIAVYAIARERDRTGIAIAWGVAGGGVLVLGVVVLAGDDYILSRNLLGLWPPFAVGLALVLSSRALGLVGIVATLALCVAGTALAIWTAATPEARRPDYRPLAAALGDASEPRLILSQTGFSSPLLVYMDGLRGASDDELRASELVLVEPRRTDSYAVGPCWWLHTCGGVDLSPPPPIEIPPGFEETDSGSTRLFDYAVYEAPEPLEVDRPTEYFTPRVFVQDPVD